MTRFPFVVLLVAALALPPAVASAQSDTLLDDTQRAAIADFFKKQAEKAAEAEKARKARESEKAKGGGRTAAKPAAKSKKAEKPKKPAAPKAAQKDKTKNKSKDKSKARTNGRNGDKAKPPARTALERGQVLAQDLPRRALPKELESQLGKPARGTQRVIVGDDVVLFERKTGRILDIVENVAKTGAPGR